MHAARPWLRVAVLLPGKEGGLLRKESKLR